MMDDIGTCPLTRGRRILVVVDDTPDSTQAVEQAISLGGICSSQMFTLAVAEMNPEYMAEAPELFERIEKEARVIAEKARDKVVAADLECQALVRTGTSAGDVIIQTAKDEEIDLIVMASQGKHFMSRILVSGAAQHVVGLAPCPVMVVPTFS